MDNLNWPDICAGQNVGRILRLAKQCLQAPTVLISLNGPNGQTLGSCLGPIVGAWPGGLPFCAHAPSADGVFHVPDASQDGRFANDPSVIGAPPIRFYAGAPFYAPSGEPLGTLCVLSGQPRAFTPDERTALRDLADCLASELERVQLAAIAEQVTRLEIVAKYIGNAIIITDAKSRVEWVNPSFERLSGYHQAEVLGKGLVDLLRGTATDPSAIGLLQQKLDAGQPVHTELFSHHKQGDSYWLDLRIHPVYDAHGRLSHFVAIETDITKRKRAEQQLQSNQSRIHAIVDTVLEGIVTINVQGVVETFNPAAEKIFGYAAEEVIGQKINILMPVSYADGHDAHLSRYLITDEKKIIGLGGREVSGRRKDGSVFPMELAVSEMMVDGARMFTGIVRDISERKLMDVALKRHEAIIRYSDDAIVSKTLDGIITSWNLGAENMFGYTAAEAIGKPIRMLVPPGLEIEEKSLLKKLAMEGKPAHLETTRRCKDGTLIDVSATLSAIIDENGDIVGLSIIARNITEYKRLERMKSEFISTVSHELRTPLTSIRGALDLVLGKSAEQLPSKARKMLNMAARNSERLCLLINDILDLEKIESGSIEFAFKSVDLIPLAQCALEDNAGYAHTHQVQLVFEDGGLGQAWVYGDEHRLLQVFANLISNAVKFSPQEGRVTISITADVFGYRITVSDQGPGIPEEFRRRIFQRFAQADSSDTRQKGGTGLGLSITKAIVERHNGTIGYTSELGHGTLFYFELPDVPNPIQDGVRQSGDAQVLICEDNFDVATILAEMLQQEGIRSDIAASIKATHTLLAKHHYRLLLLDLILPDGDGLHLLKELRAAPATRQLPVIVVSGLAMEGRKAFNGNTMTVVDWLQKPFDQERLKQAVQHALLRTQQPHILHVEDDPDIIQIVRTLLEGCAVYTHAASLSEARRLLAKQHYDLVILELDVQDGSGVELLDDLNVESPVVIFSAKAINPEISHLVNAALTKSMTSNGQLLATIKKLLAGE